MTSYEENDNWGADQEEEYDDPVRFRDHFSECPGCKKMISQDMDSCPFCGDILFRYLKDGTFTPRKGPLAKLFAILVILLIILGTVGLLLQLIF